MPDAVAHDLDGRPALVESDEGTGVSLRLSDGTRVVLPQSLVTRRADGSYHAAVVFSDLDVDRHVLREVEERVDIRAVERERSRVVARTITDVHHEPVDADGWRETVEVERVPIGRPVGAVEPVREEDGVTVIPVYEEVLVVQKQLVLREEVRLTTRREPVPGPATVALRRQRVEVERHAAPTSGDPEG